MPKADYGVDAPAVPFWLGFAALAFLAWAVGLVIAGAGLWWLLPAAYAVFFALSAAVYLHTTRRGKFVVWRELLATAGLAGTERIIDLGCGRGAVLHLAAKRLTGAKPLGVDLWRSVDQSGNDPARTAANAAAERVETDLITGDLRALPVRSASVDLVLSSLAIHNIPNAEGRAAAVREAARILRPGGRLILVDFRHVKNYADELGELGFAEVRRRSLGWRFWYGGPWGASSVVTATRA